MVFRRAILRSISCVIFCFAIQSQLVQASVWDGGGADNNWSSPQNWANDLIPINDGTADISLAGSTRLTPSVDIPWNIHSLTFGSNYNFTLNGSTLAIGSGGISSKTLAVQKVNNAIQLNADQIWDTGNSSKSYLLDYGAVDTNGHSLTVTGAGSVMLAGNVSGTGSLIVSAAGSGSLVAYGLNTYSGGTFINGGELYITSNSALGAAGSPVSFNGGFLMINPDQSTTTIDRDINLGLSGGTIRAALAQWYAIAIPTAIHGPGALTISGGGGDTFYKLTGNNSYSGGTFVREATLQGTTNAIKGNVTLQNYYSQIQFQQDFNGTYDGNISGDGHFNKKGAGVVTLTGNNSYSGYTNLYEGTLEIYANGAGLPSNSRLFFQYSANGGGVLQFVGPMTYTPVPGTDVIWNGAGGFSARDGKLTVNLGGNGAQYNLDPMNGGGRGALIFGSPTANSVTEFQNPLYLGSNQSSPAPSIRVIAGTGGDYAVLSGQISGENWLLKTGEGTLKLTAANTFSGGLFLREGATQCNDGVGLPSATPLTFEGGVLLSDGDATFTRSLGTGSGQVNWTNSGGFAAANGTLYVNLGGNGTYQSWGSANFVPNGYALVFGATRASGQTVFLNSLYLGSATREIRVNAGLGNDVATLSGVITGTGGLTKTGSGMLEFAASNIYRGPTTISAGTVKISNVTGSATGTGTVVVNAGATLTGTGIVDGPLTVAGILSPGNGPGILSANNKVTFQSSSTFKVDIKGLTAGSEYDQLATVGAVSLSGTLELSFGDFAPSGHDILFLINNKGVGATSGAFQYTDDTRIGTFNGCDWYITYDAKNAAAPSLNGGNDVAIYSIPVPEPSTLFLMVNVVLGMVLYVWRKPK